MGLIRILLAISVIIAHSNPIFGLSLIGGRLAVEIFFVISGFYMALILTEKYNKKNNYKLFLSNRLLKIFPTYYLILLACLIFQLTYVFILKRPDIPPFFDPKINKSLFSIIFLITSNLIILGQDLSLFMGINKNTGNLYFTSNFRSSNPPLYDFMFINQAWTLALEIIFYSMAPFINKFKNRYLLLIMAISLAIRFTLYHFGFNQDPWTYRFFPSEIFFFVSGIVSYRLYKLIQNIEINPKILISIYSLYLSFIIFYQFIPHNRTKQTLLFFFTIILLPLFFKLSKNIKLDSLIGELSYPVYICHFLIIDIITHLTNFNHQYLGLLATIIAISVSFLIIKLVLNPINNFRQSRILLQSKN
jgi:peptidoglycan/LPS O-acetylase OafA/YrhL